MAIGTRLKLVRLEAGRTVREFAALLGLSHSYVAELEKDKKTPSERVVQHICRALGVNRRWLEEGKGKKQGDRVIPYISEGHPLTEQITQRLIFGPSQVSVSTVARLLGIDVENFPANEDRVIKLASNSIDGAVRSLVRIFCEGNEAKMDAILGLLTLLAPDESKEGKAEDSEIENRTQAMRALREAREADKTGDYDAARSGYLFAIDWLGGIEKKEMAPRPNKGLTEAVAAYKDFAKRDSFGAEMREMVTKAVRKKPGIDVKGLQVALPSLDGGQVVQAVRGATVLGKIRCVEEGQSHRLYPVGEKK